MADFLSKGSDYTFNTLDELASTDCDEDFKEYLAFEPGISTCLYICLGISIIVTKCRFSHVALVNTPIYPLSLKFKMIAQIFMIILFLAGAVLSFIEDNFWINSCSSPFIGLVYLIPVVVLILNIDWIKFQFERKIPLLWFQNQLFWGLTSVSYLFAFISCYLITTSPRFNSPDFILVVLKLLDSIVLMVYTIRRRQDLTDFLSDSGLRSKLMKEKNPQEAQKAEQVSFWRRRDLIKKKSLPSTIFSYSICINHNLDGTKVSFADEVAEPPLAIIVANKIQRRVDPKTGAMEVIYKLHVKTGTQEHKILRTLNDFKRLEKWIITEMSDNNNIMSALDSLNAIFSDPDSENISSIAFVVLTLQNFFNTLLKADRLPDSLLKFLEIPEFERLQLKYLFKKFMSNKDEKIDQPEIEETRKRGLSIPKAPGLEDIEEEDNDSVEYLAPDMTLSQSSSMIHVTKATEKDYCPFFSVAVPSYRRAINGDYIEFTINLKLLEKPDETWQITKRYSDFIEIRQQLRNSLKILPPKLPKKLIVVTEDEQLEERRKGLESWLRIVLNEKIYFLPQLFQFVNLNPAYYEWIKDEEAYDFTNFKAIIDKNHILMNNNKPYTVYHILIEERSDVDIKKKKRLYTLYRRYKEFYQLHEALQMRFSNISTKLPELPPKYTTFSNKTSVDFRQQGLERYLNQLFSFPNIGDSFAFRKFINFKRPVDSFITGKDTTAHMFSSFDPEPQNISNETIEKSLSTAKNKKN